MRISVAQFAAVGDPEVNVARCREEMTTADADGSALLVLPEGVLARFPGQEHLVAGAAQPLDGPFVTALLAHSSGLDTTVVVGVHETSGERRPFNTLLALRGGEILAVYRKLHLYDAFAVRESDSVKAGDELPPVFDCAGWSVGLMTCYDVRFPETARSLTDRGAQILALPAAWVRGPAKERHWELMVAARALENTCYVAACGECGPRNIGQSMIVDPLGTVLSRLADRPGRVTAQLDRPDLDAARETLPVLANRRFELVPTVRPPAGYALHT